MPLYDFECSKCSYVFEVFLKMNDGFEELSCPQCGARKPRKLVSPLRTNAWSTFLDKMERRISPEKFN